jgi:hypothetical protein
MNMKQDTTQALPPDQSVLPETQAEQTTEQHVPIEVKWRLPAWMLRDPGKRVRTHDDVTFQKEGKRTRAS